MCGFLAAHRFPRRLNPIAGSLVTFGVIAEVDCAQTCVGKGRLAVASLVIEDAEHERCPVEGRRMVPSPQASTAGRCASVVVSGGVVRCGWRCECGDTCDECEQLNPASSPS